MKNFLVPITLVCAATIGYGQITNPKCQPLIDAEHAFIAMAKDKNTRDAFVAFLSDSAITFDKNGPRIGKEHLKQQQPNESLLSWDACYSDIAASGDWGFNIGPWSYRPNKMDADAVAFGHFVTVWVKEKSGNWRALVDIGISHAKPEPLDPITNSKISSKAAGEKLSISDALTIEKNFIEAQNTNPVDAYSNAMSAEARLLRNGSLPIESKDAIIAHLKISSVKNIYTPVGGKVSPSGDMLFVFGTAMVDLIKNGQPSTGQMNYVRIWKRENGSEWKLVVDILS
jgi:ketosteroid isomerase-like protein